MPRDSQRNQKQVDEKLINERLLYEIAKRPFDGSFRKGTLRGKGSRRAFLLRTMKEAGLSPTLDKYGNIWAETGTWGKTRVMSSHMDVDPRCPSSAVGIRKTTHARHGHVYQGVLDNAVGCYINILLALSNAHGQRTAHVFTASEEAPLGRTSFAMSANDVIRELKRKNLKPSVCVAIDITYPRLKVRSGRLDKIFDTHQSPQLFDHSDKVHTYIDGITGRSKTRATRLAKRFINQYTKAGSRGRVKTGSACSVRMRKLPCWDEAEAYSKIAPSFAFGPVVFGKFDQPNQMVPRKNILTALNFLRHLTV